MAMAEAASDEFLPPDLHYQVLSHLSLQQLMRLRNVSRGWRSVTDRRLRLVQRICAYDLPLDQQDDDDEEDGLLPFHADDCFPPAADPYVLESLLRLCPGVRQLAVQRVPAAYRELKALRLQLPRVADLLNHVTHLVWNDARVRIPLRPDWRLRHLTCRSVSANELTLLLHRGLRSLRIDETDFRAWERLPADFTCLVVRRSPVDLGLVAQSAGMRSLRRVEAMSAPAGVWGSEVRAPLLSRLSLVNAVSYEDDLSGAQALADLLHAAPRVADLRIRVQRPQAPYVSNTPPPFFRHLRRLTRLTIDTAAATADPVPASDLHLDALAACVPLLAHLVLALPDLSPDELMAVSRVPCLHHVSVTLTACRSLSSRSLLHFVHACLTKQPDPVHRLLVRGFDLLFTPQDQRRLLLLVHKNNSFRQLYVTVNGPAFSGTETRLQRAMDGERLLTSVSVLPAVASCCSIR